MLRWAGPATLDAFPALPPNHSGKMLRATGLGPAITMRIRSALKAKAKRFSTWFQAVRGYSTTAMALTGRDRPSLPSFPPLTAHLLHNADQFRPCIHEPEQGFSGTMKLCAASSCPFLDCRRAHTKHAGRLSLRQTQAPNGVDCILTVHNLLICHTAKNVNQVVDLWLTGVQLGYIFKP